MLVAVRGSLARPKGYESGRDRPGRPGEAEFAASTADELLSQLGAGEYAQALAEGQAMSLDEAIDYALASLD